MYKDTGDRVASCGHSSILRLFLSSSSLRFKRGIRHSIWNRCIKCKYMYIVWCICALKNDKTYYHSDIRGGWRAPLYSTMDSKPLGHWHSGVGKEGEGNEQSGGLHCTMDTGQPTAWTLTQWSGHRGGGQGAESSTVQWTTHCLDTSQWCTHDGGRGWEEWKGGSNVQWTYWHTRVAKGPLPRPFCSKGAVKKS